MGTSKLELAVGTGQWDAGLKKAQQALNSFTQAQGGLQQALAKDNGDMQKFIQMMGKIDSTANTAKGQMNDYKRVLEQLTAQYSQMSDAQKKSIGQDYLQTIDALKQKFAQAKQQVDDFNRSLGETSNAKLPDISGGGGMFGGKLDGMLQVFGGNLMTKAAGAVAQLGSEMADMVKQGIEMAKAGEGVRIAFERLGRGDILQGLREATHGTVTDLELMKAAVKFNDFKLPLDELGTMLAFAQQKAKDTGQSVDAMVESIVTGLGRKSLMILDNLGLSASEIKERMAETGDMTKAVGAIIREQMAKAGDYVETAADRAAKADTDLQNAMRRLGETLAPLQEAGTSLFTSWEVSALNFIRNALDPLIARFTEAGRLQASYNRQGGSGKVNSMANTLQNTPADRRQGLYNAQVNSFNSFINERQDYINLLNSYRAGARGEGNGYTPENKARIDQLFKQFGTDDTSRLQSQIDGATKQLQEYQKAAKNILTPPKTATPDTPTKTTTTSTGGKTPQQQAQDKVAAALLDYQQTIEKANLGLKEGYTSELDVKRKQLSAQERLYDAYGDAYNMYHDPKYKEAQDKAAEEIVRLQGEVAASAEAQKKAQEAARALETAQNKLADAQLKLAEAQESGDLKQIYAAEKNVQNAQKGVDLAQSNLDSLSQSITVEVLPKWAESALNALPQEIKDKLSGKTDVQVPLTTANLDAFIANTKKQLASSDLGSGAISSLQENLSDSTAIAEIMTTALKNGIDTAEFDTSGLMKKLMNGEDISDETIQSYVDQLNEKLKEKFDETEWPKVLIKFNIDKKQIEGLATSQKKEVDAMTKSWQTAASAIQGVGNVLSMLEDPTAKIIGLIAQAIASVAAGAGQAISNHGGKLEHGGPWAWIAFAAAATATMIGTIASIKSVTSSTKRASGGFVPGTKYSGDNIMANGGTLQLDAGELVLNRAQQTNLANQLDGNGMSNLNLSTRITAEDIEIILNNRFERQGLGEIVTTQ